MSQNTPAEDGAASPYVGRVGADLDRDARERSQDVSTLSAFLELFTEVFVGLHLHLTPELRAVRDGFEALYNVITAVIPAQLEYDNPEFFRPCRPGTWIIKTAESQAAEIQRINEALWYKCKNCERAIARCLTAGLAALDVVNRSELECDGPIWDALSASNNPRLIALGELLNQIVQGLKQLEPGISPSPFDRWYESENRIRIDLQRWQDLLEAIEDLTTAPLPATPTDSADRVKPTDDAGSRKVRSANAHRINLAKKLIRNTPGIQSKALARALDVEVSSFNSNYSPILRAEGFVSRGVSGGWEPESTGKH